MDWTLLVPGALPPAALAPDIIRAMNSPRLAGRLGAARLRSARQAPERLEGAAHWSWLAQAFGMDAEALVTAPYAWRAAAAPPAPEAGDPPWVAHADPMHMVVARDHLALTDLADAPLRQSEAAELLELANEAARTATVAASGGPATLRFAIRGGNWFLLCDRPLELRTVALDAVLGRSVQQRMPEGSHARALRILVNDIQMRWHASEVNAAREERGERPANALWMHGAGAWQPLPGSAPRNVPSAGGALDAAILRGWHEAAAPSSGAPAGRLSVFGALFAPYAHRSWNAWLERVPALEQALEDLAAQAQAEGAREIELVLCGQREARSFALPLQASWWRRAWPGGATQPSAAALLRSLGEEDR